MICTVRDTPFHYEQRGTGKPVLFLHGFRVDHRLMTGCLEPVFEQKHGYKRIYLDLPGMGETLAPAWIKNADDMLEAIKMFAELVIPDEQFLVIGESYGGYLTLGLIRDMTARIDGAMLICPVIYANSADRRLPQKHIVFKTDSFDTIDDAEAVNNFLDIAVVATPEIYKKYKNDILPGVSAAAANADFLSRYEKSGYAFSNADNLAAMTFSKPVSILTGRQDHITGYADAFDVLSLFPRAAFAVLDGCGHNLQIESESLFISMVNEWLARVNLYLS